MHRALSGFITLCLLVTFTAKAQVGKMSLRLFMTWQSNPRSLESVKLLVRGDASTIEQFAGLHGGRFKFAAGDVASIDLPLTYLPALANEYGVERIEGLSGYNGRVLDDRTDTNVYMHPVRTGKGLPQGYTGKGVIMGFIDTGIDFKHPDFKNPADTHKTRILKIWDQNASGNAPTGYGYGYEWDSTDINNGTCTHDDPANEYGHGTNVAGLGAGNGRANASFTGIAPASDIMVVSTLFDNNFLSNTLDGVKYIFDKADALGKPCVINISQGDYSGSHDGRDLYSQMLNNLITAKQGRMVVCAAGNGGNAGNWHLGYSASSTPQFTFFNYTNYYGGEAFELFIDSSKYSGLQFALGAVNSTYTTNRGTTSYLTFNGLSLAHQNIDSIKGSITGVGSYTIYVQIHDNVLDAIFLITPTNSTDHWRLLSKGSGHIDIWSAYNVLGTSDMLSSGIPAAYQSGYVYPDKLMTTVGYFTLADKCLTVGNYNNRNSYTDYYGHTQYLNSLTNLITIGDIASSSSLGPTRLFKVKPEIASPGDATMAPSRLATATALIANGQGYKVAQGGKYNRNGGTSLASPVVAGIVALYLQKHPKATWQQIKDAVILNAVHDKFTTSLLPNNYWGFGKVNAYAALKNDFLDSCNAPCVPISITRQPANVYACSGKPVVISLAATGGCVHYQWQYSIDTGKTFTNLSNTSPYKNVNTDSLLINPVSPLIYNTLYRCAITGCYPGVVSQNVGVRAVLTSVYSTRIIPDTNRVCYNSRAFFHLDSTLSNYITWQYSFNPGASNSSWTTISTGKDSASVANIKQATFVRALVNIGGCTAFFATSSVALPDSTIHIKLNGVTSVSLSISWNKTLASSYKIIINGTSYNQTTTSKTFTGLTPNTTYKIVLKESGNSCGNKSDSISVTTLCSAISDSLLSVGIDTARFKIKGGSGHYKLYFKPINAANYLSAIVTNGVATLRKLLAHTTYLVHAYDSASTCSNNTSSVLYVNTGGSACTLSGPVFTNVTTTSNSINVHWAGSAALYQYYYRVHGSAGCNSYSTSADSAIITGLSANTLYDLFVTNRCTSPAAFGYSTVIDTIRTKVGCGTPANLILSNINCRGFDATWNKVSGAKDYSVLMVNTANNSALSYASTSNIYTINVLKPTSGYKVSVRVRTCNSGFGGAISNTESVSLPACTNKADDYDRSVLYKPLENNNAVKIYPNPASAIVKIASDAPWHKIYVSNLQGNRVYSNETINYMLEVDVHLFPAGIYICTVVNSDGSISSHKLIVTP